MQEEHLVIKKLSGDLTPQEEQEFELWLSASPQNKKLYDRLKNIQKQGKDLNTFKQLDLNEVWQEIVEKAEVKPPNFKTTHKLYIWSAAAAVFIGICIVFNFIYSPFSDSLDKERYTPYVNVETNGNTEQLQEQGKKALVQNEAEVALQYGDTLDYSAIQSTKAQAALNTLRVPYGKTYNLKLADGTHIKLNSGSSITYPTHFDTSSKRNIQLEGEAFFDVSHNPKKPFVVTTNNLEVTVIGTSFNVSSYKEDPSIDVVLVEGAVALSQEDQNRLSLSPNEKGSFDKKEGSFRKSKVNIRQATAWLEGKLVIENKSFSDIIKKLERRFNVEIENTYAALNEQYYTATFDVESLEDILSVFAEDIPFKYSKTTNSKIMIEEP